MEGGEGCEEEGMKAEEREGGGKVTERVKVKKDGGKHEGIGEGKKGECKKRQKDEMGRKRETERGKEN